MEGKCSLATALRRRQDGTQQAPAHVATAAARSKLFRPRFARAMGDDAAAFAKYDLARSRSGPKSSENSQYDRSVQG